MKKYIIPACFLLVLVSGHFFCNAQSIGINTITPDSTAVLDLTSTNKGLLPPRMTAQQRNTIVSPASGLIVYQTDTPGLYINNGTPAAKNWQLLKAVSSTGQANTSASFACGTTSGIFYAGTTYNVPFSAYSDNNFVNQSGNYVPLRSGKYKIHYDFYFISNTSGGLFTGVALGGVATPITTIFSVATSGLYYELSGEGIFDVAANTPITITFQYSSGAGGYCSVGKGDVTILEIL